MMTTLVLAAVMNMGGVEVNGEWVTKTERREFADGYAERYVLPEGKRVIGGERTTWTLPADATVWYQAMSAGGRGGYENLYETCAAGDVPEGTLLVLPVTAKLKDGTYVLITEADLVDYTDLVVKSRGDGTFVADYHAETGSFEQTGRAVTPWRVTLVAKDLQTLATSDIVRRLCPEPPADRAAKAAAFAKPGRCVWQWLPSGQPVYAEQREWYDRTKALGFEYYLIDAGWKKWRDGDKDEWACLKEVIDYGRSIGVKTAIWVDSKEIPTPETRLAYLRKVKASGAVGIKIDYVPKCDVNWCRWYEETLRDTYELGLFVDFHGCVKPTGRERTWPHELAREAIRGHEWHITRYNRVLPFEHDTILPFCRLVQGHGDYTPMVFEPRELIHFTWARQLAQGVIFSAPFLCFGDFPKNYLENPAVDFIKSLPSVYDEVRVLPGSEIGVCAAFAKRKGDTWYLAIENGATPRRFAVDLSFLKGACRAEAFGDAPTRLDGYVKTKYAVKPTDALQIDLRAGGGYAARLVPDDGKGPAPAPYVAPLTDETAEEKAARMAWWTDARFGLFIHFGLYAMPARHEWIKKLETLPEARYDEYFKRFDPDLFDAKAWAKAARRAGMKYAVLTTKHHEGFCLWDSKATDYKITKTPFGRDLVREFVDAFRAEGLRVGFYYSLIDWHHPDFTVDVNHPRRPKTAENYGTRGDGTGTYEEINAHRDMAKYRRYMKDQVRELLTDYGRIDIVWFDFSYPERERGFGPGKGREDWDSAGLVRLARSLQPQVIIDDRLDLSDVPGGWDFVSPEQVAVVKRPTVNGAYVPWEACQTFSGSWGYHRDEATWKADETVLSLLVGAVSKGGNLILNVGPTARGEFDERAMAKLDMLGGWMRGNARSIYGCTIAPERFAAPEGTKLTWNPKTRRLYVHLFEYPFKRIELAFGGEVAYAQFLHDGSELPVRTGSVGKHSGDERTATYVEIPQIRPPVKVPVIELFLRD